VAGEGTVSAPAVALKRVIGHLPREFCSDSAELKAVFARVSKQRATSQSRVDQGRRYSSGGNKVGMRVFR
jgi:hypothetical protein